MPIIQNQQFDHSFDLRKSEANPASETLFLLSICRDEDDAAALRSDLKRSDLSFSKVQRCLQLDDAIHLLQVCGFDLVFLRLDDFQDRQAAIDLVRQNDPDLPIVGLVSSRLLASPEFEMPSGIDASCRLEDLSPTLVSNIVSSVLRQRRERRERRRLSQELNHAINAGGLGTWDLDIETGRVTLDSRAAQTLAIASVDQTRFFDDLLELAYSKDQDRLKRLFDLAIETQGDLDTNFHLERAGREGPSVQISAVYRPGTPREHPRLSGFLKRETQAAEEIQEKIESANQAIQKALSLRDEAIAAASKELELLMLKLGAMENAPPKASLNPQPPAEPAPIRDREQKTASQAPAPNAADSKTPEKSQPAQAAQPAGGPDSPGTSETLALAPEKSIALQNVLKTITRQKKAQSSNTFPFDFSTETTSDYTEPSPEQDGFIGASKRLIEITQNGHELSVTLSVENDGSIENEREQDLLFEILRELLTNVVKHARATECIIALFRDEDDWVLQVEDDGIGLENNLVSISTPLNKIGLFRIRTKLALKGGQLDLTPTFPKGLIARARLPVSLLNRESRDAERA